MSNAQNKKKTKKPQPKQQKPENSWLDTAIDALYETETQAVLAASLFSIGALSSAFMLLKNEVLFCFCEISCVSRFIFIVFLSLFFVFFRNTTFFFVCFLTMTNKNKITRTMASNKNKIKSLQTHLI